MTDVYDIVGGEVIFDKLQKALPYNSLLPKTVSKSTSVQSQIYFYCPVLPSFFPPTVLISTYQAYWLINQLQPSLRAHTAKTQRKLNNCFISARLNYKIERGLAISFMLLSVFLCHCKCIWLTTCAAKTFCNSKLN